MFSLIATQNKTKLSWVKTGQHHIIFNIIGKTTKRGGREETMIRKTWFFNCWDLKQKIVDKFRARGWATWWSHRERFISEDHGLVTASHLFIKQHTHRRCVSSLTPSLIGPITDESLFKCILIAEMNCPQSPWHWQTVMGLLSVTRTTAGLRVF